MLPARNSSDIARYINRTGVQARFNVYVYTPDGFVNFLLREHEAIHTLTR